MFVSVRLLGMDFRLRALAIDESLPLGRDPSEGTDVQNPTPIRLGSVAAVVTVAAAAVAVPVPFLFALRLVVPKPPLFVSRLSLSLSQLSDGDRKRTGRAGHFFVLFLESQGRTQ